MEGGADTSVPRRWSCRGRTTAWAGESRTRPTTRRRDAQRSGTRVRRTTRGNTLPQGRSAEGVEGAVDDLASVSCVAVGLVLGLEATAFGLERDLQGRTRGAGEGVVPSSCLVVHHLTFLHIVDSSPRRGGHDGGLQHCGGTRGQVPIVMQQGNNAFDLSATSSSAGTRG